MASHELIDAQFDRAVQIVQGLPKTGPIQTDYEEKLEMYRYVKLHEIDHGMSTDPFRLACISKVLLLRANASAPLRAHTIGFSYGRECEEPQTWDMGHAGTCKMVGTAENTFFRVPADCRDRDAWAKHKDLDTYEAKWLYVEALLKVRS